MTKLEILFSYKSDPIAFGQVKDYRVLDSWYALGRNLIQIGSDYATKNYLKGALYLLNCSNSKLHNSILYCIEDYIGNLEWEAVTLEDTALGYISFGNNVISSHFRFITDAPIDWEAGSPGRNFYRDYPGDPEFVPFQEEYQKTDVVQINDDDYALCITALGSPFIMDEELEYTREQITNYVIRPSLEEYFKWFPKTDIKTYNVTANAQDIEFPKDAYDVIHFDVQQYGNNANGMITNTLLRAWTESMYGINNQVGAAGGVTGKYMNGMNTYFSNRAYSQAILNYHTRCHINKYIDNNGKRWVKFYSTKAGTAEIHWAIKTLNFNEVEFARRPELIKLCNANAKLFFANLRRQMKSDIPGIVDYKDWVNEAKTEIEEVRKDWQQIVKYSGVLRGGQ